MFELAKTVLTKAGGTSSTSLFTQPTANQSHRGPHRALHMCAFQARTPTCPTNNGTLNINLPIFFFFFAFFLPLQIGLYALGLHNSVNPNWLSRTYSSHGSWITGQAMELGASALSFLIRTWEGHLTPPEVQVGQA